MERADDSFGHHQKPGYWTRRSSLMYYQYVDFLVRALATDAGSLIDVGSADAQYIENFYWIPERTTLDMTSPYSSENVTGIEMDFFDFEPEEKYDFATCLQVLEHVPDAEAFTRKLFQTAHRVLISVPYLWKEKPDSSHVHDPVDLEKLSGWAGREPDYYIVVREPLLNSYSARRLIGYYHLEEEELDIKKARRSVPGIPTNQSTPPLDHGAQHNGRPRPETSRHHPHGTPGDGRRRSEQPKRGLEARLKELEEKLEKTTKERELYSRLYHEIEQSRTWRYTQPVRKLLDAIRNSVSR